MRQFYARRLGSFVDDSSAGSLLRGYPAAFGFSKSRCLWCRCSFFVFVSLEFEGRNGLFSCFNWLAENSVGLEKVYSWRYMD